MTLVLSYSTWVTTFASGVYSSGIPLVSKHFSVSAEVATLGVSLYVIGFATGPIIWGPFSELKGRRLPLVIAAFGSMVFQFAAAVSKDLQTLMICRFWAGFFGASPLAVAGAVFADLFPNKTRGLGVNFQPIVNILDESKVN